MKAIKDFRDIYEFPLHKAKLGSWVYDAKGNFVFQFERDLKPHLREEILRAINGEKNIINGFFSHIEGEIIEEGFGSIITIRGWGNLTGTGAHNLPSEVAANIQDTFAEYIVERLNSDQ